MLRLIVAVNSKEGNLYSVKKDGRGPVGPKCNFFRNLGQKFRQKFYKGNAFFWGGGGGQARS
jgi:hypothetical protein